MKIKKYTLFLTAMACLLTSCNDWLDVKSDLEEKQEDLFSTEEGFRSALTGCYQTLASQDIYGEKLTMTDIESLACLWDYSTSSDNYQNRHYLSIHEYDNDNAADAIKTIYAGLFNVITQANVIIEEMGKQGEAAIVDEQLRAVIEGEAYALRAYCQFDVLRMFGQLPQGGTQTVRLPYSYMTELGDYPSYYDYDEYVANLKADIEMAENLLKDNDPVCQYSFDDISSEVSDEFLTYRQFRLNYWAVKALQARMALYLGETENAYNYAMEIINEEYDGSAKFQLSGSTDLSTTYNYYACPSEALFMLSKSDLKDYADGLLVGQISESATEFYNSTNYYLISESRFATLFSGVVTASDNRYRACWCKNVKNNVGATFSAIKKYYYEDDDDNLMYKHKVIPMLRMSEIYLIAMETAPLDEANSLYSTYMRSHDVLVDNDTFASTTALKTELLNEYRRELFAEGQMFFTYKRLNSSTILWYGSADEDDYILPLPNTEYESNN